MNHPRVRELGLAAAGLLVLFVLYLSFPERVYVFDGVMFAGVIERGVDDWRAEVFNRRHLLFNPMMMAARDSLASLGVRWSGYDVMQRANALFGALGIGLFFLILKRATKDLTVSLLGAALLAVSSTYWSRAIEGQVYMSMTLGALTTLWAALWLLEKPGPASAAALAACAAAAVSVHAANAALAGMGLAALYFSSKRGRSWAGVAAVGSIALVGIAYAFIYKLSSPAALLSFFVNATEYRSAGSESWGSLVQRFFTTGGLRPLDRLSLILDELYAAVAVNGGRPWSVLGGAAMAGGIGFAAWRGLKDQEQRATAAVFLAFGGAFLALNVFWLGGLFFWVPPLAAAIGLGALWASKKGLNRQALGGVGGLVLALGVWNFALGVRPQADIRNNAGHRAALFVAEHTTPSSWIVISGYGAFPNAKVYLGYFAHRSRQVIEYYFDRHPKAEALSRLAGFLDENMASGIPIYLLNDLVEDAGVQKLMKERWDLTMDELRGPFGSGTLLPLARSPEGVAVYLFAPHKHLVELYCGMAFTAATAPPGTHLDESVTALRAISKMMTPEQRKQAGKLLVKSDYGMAMIFEGFSRYMNGASLESAKKRVAKFAEYRKTPDFMLRAGNLYVILGLVSEARREWTEAYRLSKDPRLAAELAKLR
jgi:hypothetical protein